jgi:polysaccharide pyruvyl transferase WcaK-like protein
VSADARSSATPDASRSLCESVKATLKALPVIYPVLKAIRAAATSVLDFLDEAKFLVTSFTRLKGTDLLIVPGSGVLSDHFGGPLNFPYTLLKWSLLAKVSQTRLAFLSVGAGPLNSPLSRRLVKYSLSVARYRSYRDITSKRLLDNLGVPTTAPVLPDLAASLRIDSTPSRPNNHRPIVGINAFPYFDPRYWPVSDTAKYQRYITTLTSFTSWLIHNNYKVFFFPTQIRADTLVIQDVKNLLTESGDLDLRNSLLEFPIHDVADLTARLAAIDLVVATRFHAILLSFLVNKPVLALSNHHKMADLMADMGQSQYLLDINTFFCESLIERFTTLKSNSETVKRQVAYRISEYRRALDRQYDILLTPISRRSVADMQTDGLPMRRQRSLEAKQA